MHRRQRSKQGYLDTGEVCESLGQSIFLTLPLPVILLLTCSAPPLYLTSPLPATRTLSFALANTSAFPLPEILIDVSSVFRSLAIILPLPLNEPSNFLACPERLIFPLPDISASTAGASRLTF